MDTLTTVERLLMPQSVAIIGASSDEDSMGGAPLANLLEHDYRGEIFLVNPRRDSIRGIECFKEIGDLPHPVDTAIVVTPTEAAHEVISQLQGVTSTATVVATGFHVTGSSDNRLTRVASAAGIRILGPNTTGVLNLNGAYCPRAARNHPPNLKPGPVALIAQSGGVGNTVFNRAQAQGMGIGLFVGTGDSSDITPWDVAQSAVQSDDIQTVLLIIEGRLPALELEELSRAAHERDVNLLLYKMARTDSGQRTAITHTGSISGSSNIGIAAAAQMGFTVVDDVDALWQIGWILSDRKGRRQSRGASFATNQTSETAKVGIITLSGGLGVVAADVADELGLALIEPNADLALRVAHEVGLDPKEVGNPFDPGSAPMRDPEGCARACRMVIDKMEVDETILLVPVMQDRVARRVLSRLVAGLAGYRGNLTVSAYRAGPSTEESIGILKELGAPMIEGVRPAVYAVARALESEHSIASRSVPEPRTLNRRERDRSRSRTRSYWESRTIITRNGVPFVQGSLVQSVEEAFQLHETWGPLVLKGSVSSQPHKVAAGLVALDVRTKAALEVEFESIRSNACSMEGYDGIACEALADDGVDFLVGGTVDEEFGPVLTVATGGRYAETAGDAVMLPLPTTNEQVEEALLSTIAGRTMMRTMSDASGLLSRLVETAQAMSGLLVNDAVDEIDVNPLRCCDDGTILALDALVVTGQ